MSIIPEWAPGVHPMLVHFPIAILSIAILFDFLSFFLSEKQKWRLPEITAYLYGVGAVTAIVVYFTGQAAADNVFLSTGAESVLNTHADWAWWTVWYYGIYALVRILVTWQISVKCRRGVHILFFVFSLVGFFLLFQTGDNGAKLVFKHGVGVQVQDAGERNNADGESADVFSGKTAFSTTDNGNWRWDIDKGAVRVLQKRFRFLAGEIENLNAESVQFDGDSYALQFTGDHLDSFFVTRDTYLNVQVDYHIAVSEFTGKVSFVNHVKDAQNYDFVTLSSDGTVSQGRVSNGKEEIFAQEKYPASEKLFVRTVVNDTHFRAYINKKMVVHGHGNAPDAGSVGLKLQGSGTIRINSIAMTQLN